MMFRVEVVQTNVFYVEAEDDIDAKRQVQEEYIWDEDQRAPNSYGVHFNVEESKYQP